MRTTAGTRGKPSESIGGEGKGRGREGVRTGRWERRDGEEGEGGVRKGKSALLMKERKKERDVFFRPLPRGAI